MQTIGKNIVSILLGVAIAILVLQNCTKQRLQRKVDAIEKPDTTRISHTFTTDTFIYVKNVAPTFTGSVPHTGAVDSVYIADTSFPRLLQQYSNLLAQFLATNNYSDTVHLDSLQWVLLRQSVYKNQLLPYNVAAKNVNTHTVETVTINNPPKKRFQLYGGFEVLGNRLDIINGGAVGILAKTRGDNIYKINYGLLNSKEFISIGGYWKLKLSRK